MDSKHQRQEELKQLVFDQQDSWDTPYSSGKNNKGSSNTSNCTRIANYIHVNGPAYTAVPTSIFCTKTEVGMEDT